MAIPDADANTLRRQAMWCVISKRSCDLAQVPVLNSAPSTYFGAPQYRC
jgi:hypothetical protein